MFQLAYQEQTRKFENNVNPSKVVDQTNVDLDEYLIQVAQKLEKLEKQNLVNADSNLQFDSNFGLLQYVYLPSNSDHFSGTIANFGGSGSGGSGDTGGPNAASSSNVDQEASGKIYEPKVRLMHSYFLSTMINFRSSWHFLFDLVILCMSIAFWFGGMNNLVKQGYIENYHTAWRIDINKWF